MTENKEDKNTNQEIEWDRAVSLIENIENDLRALKQILFQERPDFESNGHPALDSSYFMNKASAPESDVVEGIFDGERMIDAGGKTYQVSANYASKSKLIEGDPLKLYITPDGKYFYKQIGPIERKTIPGILQAEGNHYVVEAEDGNTYSVLTAAVTYYMSLYHLGAGDKVMIVVPANKPARWAAIDNIL